MNNNTGVTGDSIANATHRGFDDTVGDQTFFGGDNLVSQPNKVEKINIAYAKTAKRIDIKKLKRSIWETLDFTEGETDKENVVDKSPRKSKPDTPEKQELKSFKEVYSVLPEKLSQNASKNLSVPIAFVCLLYLANEKGLELFSSDTMEDFKIGIEGPRTEAHT
ncbi:condensin complex subunit 2-like [Rhopilema esculentum]|uniref:condensin complex subunit 2-like n=1 Tax=Rhopilema esculentum TaxID=499914 RepID=UPI0031E06188|eukprot:gene11707-54_t